MTGWQRDLVKEYVILFTQVKALLKVIVIYVVSLFFFFFGLHKSCQWNNTTPICMLLGQEQSGTGRLFTYQKTVWLSTVIERIKTLTNLKHGKIEMPISTTIL